MQSDKLEVSTEVLKSRIMFIVDKVYSGLGI